jgi:ribosomal protein L11 methyltransferase
VQHELVITPKMSFGTGHHATTWQVMRGHACPRLQREDGISTFGTGTGVLAILAEMRGAADVLATRQR